MSPLVSIIIPVYNNDAYLEKSLQAVLQQTYNNKEIIVVDDSSTDNSYTIAKSFEPKGIKVLQQKNAGAAIARNRGLAAATGEYIQFLDADDYLSDDKIEKQVTALNGSMDKVALCNYVSFVADEDINKQMQVPDQSSFIFSSGSPVNFLINLWGGNEESEFIQTNCWLVPRKIIERSGGWRAYRCPDDDGEFFTRVLLASTGIVYVPGVINYYRRQSSDHKLSSNPGKKYIHNSLLTIDLKYSYIKEHVPSEKKLNKAFAKQYLDFAVYNYPYHKLLSKLALKRYKQLHQKAKLPLLGGKSIEAIKNIFGWKVAKLIKFYIG